jgi:hypothetical protein
MGNDARSKLYPNCFGARLEESQDWNNINIVFAETKVNTNGDIEKEKELDIVSDINVNKEGLKVIIKGLLDLAEEYNERYDTDILGEIVKEFEEAGEENATS